MKTKLLLFLLPLAAIAAEPEPKLIPSDASNLSLRNEVQHAIDTGLAWLKTQQKPEGFWTTDEYPAISGLVLTAFMRDPSGKIQKEKPEAVKKGFDFLTSCVQPDGGIYKKNEMLNYNTSLSMMALLAANDPKFAPILVKARKFTVGQQQKIEGSPLTGGIGYGGSRQHADLSNMVTGLEALRASRNIEGKEVAATEDLDWKAAIGFIERCQNLSEYNKEKWVSDDEKNKGGFVYFPGFSQAGEMTLPNGKVALRSYGSMSYDGLLSYIYAGVKKDDPRVKAVIEWLQKNYTLDENPGMGEQGKYYYYQTIAKALAAYGATELTLADGKKVDWRTDLAKKLINLQKAEGFWANENGRWREKDPVLVTAYCVLALEMIYGAL